MQNYSKDYRPHLHYIQICCITSKSIDLHEILFPSEPFVCQSVCTIKIISIIYSAFIYKGHSDNLGLKIFFKVGNKLKVLGFLNVKQSNIMK